jgi:hypothetical protein
MMRHIVGSIALFILLPMAAAAADLSISESDVSFSNGKPIAGEVVRIYATVQNHSQHDAQALVRFSVDNKVIGTAQPVSILAQNTDTVFIDWHPKEGYYQISIEVYDINPNDSELSNNEIEIADFIVDLDTDNDGIFNTQDLDDDGDGLEDGLERILGTNPLISDTDGDGAMDGVDEFPLDPAEKYDNDKDGIGNNADPDNDNDGVPNADDPAPFDPNITGDDIEVVVPEPEPVVPEPAPIKQPPPPPEPLPPPKPEVEYQVEEVTYTFPNESEAEYNLSILIAKSKLGWSEYQFDVLGGDESYLYLWDFGDGKFAQSIDPKHAFGRAGTFTVLLSVSDSQGGLGTAQETISVGFWSIGNPWVQVLVGVLGLLALWLVGYLLFHSYLGKSK